MAKSEIGDIFCRSWGFNQTNIDWFQVVRVTPKCTWLRPIKSKVKIVGFMNGLSRPLKGKFTGKAFLKHGRCWANKWNGNPQYCSWYA